MDISKGQVAAVAIIIAVLVQGLGGFLANADTETSCVSQFDYLTDVFGSFDGTGQDIPVDFNPRENITGYYAYDPSDIEQSKQIKNAPAIKYEPAKTANEYPYSQQPVLKNQYTLRIECTKQADDDEHPEHYVAYLTERTAGGDVPVGDPYEWNGPELTRYSGLYHESIGYITNTRINIAGQMHQGPRMQNIYDICDHIQSLLGPDLTLNLTSQGYFPCFVGNLEVDTDTSLFHTTHNLLYDQFQNYAYYFPSKSVVEIHGTNYTPLNGWLVFGDKDGGNSITFDIIQTKPDASSSWIDPRFGVSPAHQATQYVRFWDETFYPTSIIGTVNNEQPAVVNFDTNRSGRYYSEIKVATFDPDHPEVPQYHTAFILDVSGDGRGGNAEFHVKLIDPDNGHTEDLTWTYSDSGQFFNCDWTITHESISVRASTVRGISHEAEFTRSPEWLSGKFMYSTLTPDESQCVDPHNVNCNIILRLKITDVYEDPELTPDIAVFTYEEWETYRETNLATHQIKHLQEDIPFSSEATYWSNGYGIPSLDPTKKTGNGNALIGIVFATEPLRDEETGDALPTETPFNICMHYEDTANPGQYLNTWLYNDPLKKAVSVWTNTSTKMVYIGHYNEEGIRQDATAMQIGVCDHVYVELRVDKGNLSVWAAPIYEFATFLDYRASPLMDQTASIQGVLPVDHPYYKSMAQLSYNVQHTGIGPYSLGETVQTWTSGGCIVTLDDEGNLTVTKRDGGNGRMIDYYPTPDYQRAPWLVYHEDISRIIVMDGVTHIGNYSFIGLTNADGIKIQSTVTSIGTDAFAGCYQVQQIEFAQAEWAITDIGSRAFALGTSAHPVSCTVTSPGNSALGRLTAYGSEFTTFAYVDSYIYPEYPRQLVVKTVILLDGGGQYVQDGVFHPNLDYPNSPLAELVINAVVHPGGTVTLGTTAGGSTVMTPLLTMENDGVDKWISFKKADGGYLWEGQKFDWWDVHIYYVSNKIGGVDIEDVHYEGQMYLPDGTKLAQNHVYVQAGKYGTVEDIGAMVNDEHGMSDLTVRMGGVWAFSTQFNNGTNIQGSHVVWNGSAWDWDMNATLTVFALTMLMASIVLFYKFGYNIYDILLLGGSLAILWVSFTG